MGLAGGGWKLLEIAGCGGMWRDVAGERSAVVYYWTQPSIALPSRQASLAPLGGICDFLALIARKGNL